MKINLRANEKLLREGAANMQRGAEFSFILFGRKQWAAAISTQRQLAGS